MVTATGFIVNKRNEHEETRPDNKETNSGPGVANVKNRDRLERQVAVWGPAGGQHHPVDIQMFRPVLRDPVPGVESGSFNVFTQTSITPQAIQLRMDRMAFAELVRFFSRPSLHSFNGVLSGNTAPACLLCVP